METIEGTAATITAGAAADDVDPSHHEAEQQNLSDDVDDDEDRRTRIMELAQQQQMTIQLLDRVVENQRNLQGNLNESRLRRRRRQRDNDDGLVGLLEEEGQPPGNDNDMPRMQHHPPNHNHMHRHREGGSLFTVTQIYFIVSALFAFLAVVTSPSTGRGVPLFSPLQYSFDKNVQNEAVKTSSDHAEEVVEMSAMKKYRGAVEVDDNYPSKGQDSSDGAVGRSNEEFFRPPSWHYQSHHRSMKTTNTERAPKKVKMGSSPSDNKLTWEELLSESFENIRDHYKEQYIILQNFWMYGTLTNLSNPSSTTNSQREEDLLVWSIFPWNGGRKSPAKKNDDAKKLISLSQTTSGGISKGKKFSLYSIAMDVIDPPPYHAPVEESAADTTSGASSAEERKISSAGSLAEKILSSTPRLIAIANLLLALVYLIHAAIADLFLGPSNVTQSRQRGEQQGNAVDDQTRRQRRMGREKLGGYLLFKLLLISSVLDPGTDDLLILFSWYMVLSFLRSLTHLAGSTANRVSRSGQPPRPGTLRLLMAVFICDVIAAAGCIVLFRGAGWHLLLLLTCDCALVAADTMAHIVKYFGLTMEERHRSQISSTEEELANLRRRNRREQLEQYRNDLLSAESEYINDAQFNVSTLPVRPEARLERDIEERELVHTRRMKIVDVAVFLFEMSALILTMVAERRSAYRIGAQLSSHFKDAVDLDIRKASAAGDVCCICLNSMALGNVKKVGCGHLFHTHCLREVVERERSIQVARCPLCRANLITGRQIIGGNSGTGGNNTVDETGQDAQPNTQMQNNPQLNPVDTSLLRFSTEGWLPSWIPVPAFSFEVVRRETPAIVDRNPNPGGWQRFFRRGGQVEVNDDEDDNDQAQARVQDQQQQREEEQGNTSFWRRLLILLGAIPMSPEEEAIAMEQLVDMFPQYERSDLLRELRARRSAEAVVESILLGVFSGVARGG
eukprot:scaffold4151_cov137-Skeletonema_menzelii.AAC.10